MHLERRIEVFMAYYRTSFSDLSVSITPKLHMLEEHVVPWMKQWGFGLGFMGEQGGESDSCCLQHTTQNVQQHSKSHTKIKVHDERTPPTGIPIRWRTKAIQKKKI